jgi:hypothetical protein
VDGGPGEVYEDLEAPALYFRINAWSSQRRQS